MAITTNLRPRGVNTAQVYGTLEALTEKQRIGGVWFAATNFRVAGVRARRGERGGRDGERGAARGA